MMKKLVTASLAVSAFFLLVVAFVLFWKAPQEKYLLDIAEATPTIRAAPAATPSPTPTPTPVPTPAIIQMSFAGDVIFDSYVGSLIDREGISPFVSGLEGIFKSSDISMINLETPISLRGVKENDKQFTFRAKPEYINVLTELGVNMVALANNHILDYGIDAFRDTVDLLNSSKIGYAGAGEDVDEASRPLYITVKDCKIAIISSSHVIPFISWTAGVKKPGVASTYDPSRLLSEIEVARKNADIVVVYVHWGEEMKTTPLSYQKNLAKKYIDSGADMVIGSHPHVLQGLEYYKNGIICYSLGNFIFTNTKKDTMIVNVKITEKKLSEVKVIPCEINNFKTSLIKEDAKFASLIKSLEDISYGVEIQPDGTVINKNPAYK